MNRYQERQFNLPGFSPSPPPWSGLRFVIAYGTLTRPGVAPSVCELAAALVLDEDEVRTIIDSMIENGIAVEQGGVLFRTDWEPCSSSHWAKPRPCPPRALETIPPTSQRMQIARDIKLLRSMEADHG